VRKVLNVRGAFGIRSACAHYARMRHGSFLNMPSCNRLEHSTRLPIVLARSYWLPKLFACVATLAVIASIAIPWLHAVMQPDRDNSSLPLPCNGMRSEDIQRNHLDDAADCRWSLGAAAQLGHFPNAHMQFSSESSVSHDSIDDATGFVSSAREPYLPTEPCRSLPVECRSAGP
jgi:hypothetical protein